MESGRNRRPAGVRQDRERSATLRFAANLRAARHRAGLSQERLASVCRLHRTEISLLERGEREPRLATIVLLARGLGCTASSLVEDVEVDSGGG